MKRRLRFLVLAALFHLILGMSLAMGEEQVKAGEMASALVGNDELAKIEIEINKKNEVSVDLSNLEADLRSKIQYKIGDSLEWRFASGMAGNRSLILHKEEVNHKLTFKIYDTTFERTVFFLTQDGLNLSDITVNEEKTLVDIKSLGGEYRFKNPNNDGTWYPISGTTFETNFYDGKDNWDFEIRMASKKEGESFTFASDSVFLNVSRRELLREKIERVIFEAEGEQNGRLYHVNTDMEYSLNGNHAFGWVSITKNENVNIGFGVNSLNGIYVRYKNNEDVIKHIPITQESIKFVENEIEYKNGVFTKIPDGFEVTKSNVISWKAVEGNRYKVTEKGTYIFRKKASGTNLASKASENINKTVTDLGENPLTQNENAGGQAGGNGAAGGGVPNANQDTGGAPQGNAGGAGGAVPAPGGNFGNKEIDHSKSVEASLNTNDEEKKEKEETVPSKKEEKDENSLKTEENEKKEGKDVEKEKPSATGRKKNASVVILSGKQNRKDKTISAMLSYEAFGEHKSVLFQVKAGNRKIYIKANREDIKKGKKVKVFEIKKNSVILLSKPSYVASEEGLNLALESGKKYLILSAKNAEKEEKKIETSLTLSKTKISLKKGKSYTIRFAKNFETENIKSIRYRYDKKVFKIRKDGVVKAKSFKKNQVIYIDVVLKNNKKKTLKLKVNHTLL